MSFISVLILMFGVIVFGYLFFQFGYNYMGKIG
jgi:hypothetical protein